VLCAAGYNLRWLLRAVVRGRIKRLFFALWLAVLRRVIIASVAFASSQKRAIARVGCDSGSLPSAAAAV